MSGALGRLPYPTQDVPDAPNPLGSLQKYYDQLMQLQMTSRALHMPVPGGAPGQLPQVPPDQPPPPQLPPQVPGPSPGAMAPPLPPQGGGPQVPGPPGPRPPSVLAQTAAGNPPGMGPLPPGVPQPPPMMPMGLGGMPMGGAPAAPTAAPRPPMPGPYPTGPALGGLALPPNALQMPGLAPRPRVTQYTQDPVTGHLRPRRMGRAALTGTTGLTQPLFRPRATREDWKLGDEAMIPTRIQSEAALRASGIDPHTLPHDEQPVVDWETAMSDTPEGADWRRRVQKRLRDYVGIKPGRADETPEQTLERVVEFMKGNLLHIYDRIPEEWRERATHWYDGANKIAREWADKYGYTPQQIAGALAALSPQRDWFQNVDLVRRVLETHRNHQETMFSPLMHKEFQDLIDRTKRPSSKQDNMDLPSG